MVKITFFSYEEGYFYKKGMLGIEQVFKVTSAARDKYSNKDTSNGSREKTRACRWIAISC